MPDSFFFFRAWLANPLRVASVIPSGDRLADLITSEIAPGEGPVLELGPGTGVFTRALLRRGVKSKDLTLVEAGDEFAALLVQRFPEAHMLKQDAAYLPRAGSAGHRFHRAGVSGLPLLSMSRGKVMRILASAFGLLEDGANLYQFTYGWRCPVPAPVLSRLGLEAQRVGTTFSNFPPATVWKIFRSPGATSQVTASRKREKILQ